MIVPLLEEGGFWRWGRGWVEGSCFGRMSLFYGLKLGGGGG